MIQCHLGANTYDYNTFHHNTFNSVSNTIKEDI